MGLRVWVSEAVEPSLLMSFLLVTLGTAAAAHDGFFSLSYYILAIIGVTLAQNAVNVLNDYYDYRTDVDARTTKTPFSGGSKYLVTGMIKPQNAYFFGVTSLLMAVPIGTYFILTRGIALVAIVIFAAVSIYFYTTAFARICLGEFLAGLNLGPLVVIGAYFVQASNFGIDSIAVGIAPGIMIANVLFLNEVPDVEADSSAGRMNLPILLGRKRAVRLYAALEISALVWIVVAVVSGLTPLPTLLALASLPFAVKAIAIALRDYENASRLVPALGANIATAYITIALLAIGYLIAGAVRL